MPDFIQHLLDAVADQQAGRFAAAAAGFDKVLELEPDQPQALLFGGVLALRSGQLARAVGLLGCAAAGRPGNAEVQFAFGNALWTAGDKVAARNAWMATLTNDRAHMGALLNLARAQEEAGEVAEAIATCERAVAARPAHATAFAALAAAYRAAGQLDLALCAAERAVALNPALAQAHHQHGTALRRLGRWHEAANALRRAAALAPHDASSHLNLANTLHDLGDPVAAEQSCRAALAADPAMAEAHSVLCLLLTRALRFDEAIATGRDAVRLRPDLAEAHWNLGIAQLTAGDLPSGFARYEWRKRHLAFAHEFRRLATPEWTGGDLAGRRLLVLTEQGLGDAIMLIRYAPLLAGRGAEVIVACDRRLVPLLRTAPGVSAAVAKSVELPPHDLWVDQMSLPFLCGTTLDTVPCPAPYLGADPEIAARWQMRFSSSPKRRIGIAWAGNPLHSNDANRSCTADDFLPLTALPGAELVSLQVGPTAGDATRLGLADLAPALTDFAETAGLIATLDQVVTVDTAVAHLAAAMGKPTWILLPHCPEWRWLHARTDSPWYRCVRLFRQTLPGDWAGSMRRVVAALQRQRSSTRSSKPINPATPRPSNDSTTMPASRLSVS